MISPEKETACAGEFGDTVPIKEGFPEEVTLTSILRDEEEVEMLGTDF